MNKVFITSDTHFSHKNILKYCPNRQFSSIQDHDDFLVNAWNSVVSPEDMVFHLGDVCFSSVDNAVQLLNRLNGRISLVAGNHDLRFFDSSSFCNRFFNIYDTYKEIKTQGFDIVLCHYPIHEWNGFHKNSLHFYGHCHTPLGTNKIPYMKGRKDVGIDSQPGFIPWRIETIINHILEEKDRAL